MLTTLPRSQVKPKPKLKVLKVPKVTKPASRILKVRSCSIRANPAAAALAAQHALPRRFTRTHGRGELS